MAKVTRSVLKDMVKECLVEILSEGLLNSAEPLHESRPRKKRKPNSVSPETFQKRNRKLRENMQPKKPSVNVDRITDDPVMQDIFADTAATTLQSQIVGDSKKQAFVPGDGAAKLVYENEIEDLFEGSQNWASLAFSGAKN